MNRQGLLSSLHLNVEFIRIYRIGLIGLDIKGYMKWLRHPQLHLRFEKSKNYKSRRKNIYASLEQTFFTTRDENAFLLRKKDTRTTAFIHCGSR
ncbi:MAG TPA: hypothetical protein VIJ95_08365 [Hanamia sp.]